MKKRIKKFIIIIIFLLIISIFLVFYIDKDIAPIVMEYSVAQTKKIVSIIVNRSINGELLEDANIDKLYTISQSEKGDILSLDSVIVNKLTDIISDICEDNFSLIEKGNYDILKEKFNLSSDYFLIPSSLFFGKSFILNFSNDIPIKLKMLGNVSSGIKTDVREYGLNNSIVTISISISVEMMIILPFDSQIVNYSNDIPISIKLIQGSVPSYYNSYDK